MGGERGDKPKPLKSGGAHKTFLVHYMHLPPAVVAVAQPIHCLIRDFRVAAEQCVLNVDQHLPAEVLAQMLIQGLRPLTNATEGVSVNLPIDTNYNREEIDRVELCEGIIFSVLTDGSSLQVVRVSC